MSPATHCATSCYAETVLTPSRLPFYSILINAIPNHYEFYNDISYGANASQECVCYSCTIRVFIYQINAIDVVYTAYAVH